MWQQLLTAIIQGGPAVIALLLLLLVASARGWIVWGWQYRERTGELKATIATQDATIAELERQRNTLLLGGARESVR